MKMLFIIFLIATSISCLSMDEAIQSEDHSPFCQNYKSLEYTLLYFYANPVFSNCLALIQDDGCVTFQPFQKNRLTPHYLKDCITNLKLLGVAYYRKSKHFQNIIILSTKLYEDHTFPFRQIGTWKNSITKLPEISNVLNQLPILSVDITESLMTDTKVLFTEGLYDCVAIACQGCLKDSEEKTNALAHFYRKQNIEDIVGNLVKHFDEKQTKISLVSAYFTPHLLNILNFLSVNGFQFLDIHVDPMYAKAIDPSWTITIVPEAHNNRIIPKYVLIIPSHPTIYIGHGKFD